MPKSAFTNFQPFIVNALSVRPMTTVNLYDLAVSRNIGLTKKRTRDASRPTHYAWQHQLRRDQYTLVEAGVIRRNTNGTWTVTSRTAAKRFLASF
jgi:hypothetical protein